MLQIRPKGAKKKTISKRPTNQKKFPSPFKTLKFVCHNHGKKSKGRYEKNCNQENKKLNFPSICSKIISLSNPFIPVHSNFPNIS